MPAAARRTSVVLALVLPALLAVLLPTGTARAAGEPAGARIGFSNGGGFAWQSDADLARELDLMAASGAGWVRLDFDWSGVEATRGRYSWSNLDRVVDAIQSRGMKVLALPAYTPAWARPAGTSTHHPPTDPAHFAAFVRAAAARYAPKGVLAWEIWNEPNIPNFWEPKPDVTAYVTLLRAAAAAIRAVAPDATVVSGGLSPASDSADGRYVDPRTFVSRMYALGAASSFDALGVHPYSFPALPSDVRTASWNTFQKLTTIRQTMLANADGLKQIWLTETGAPTGTSSQAVSEQRQADIVSDTIRATEGLAWAGPVFLYAARDAGTDLTDREDNFGLLRHDFSPKPAWSALTTALRPAAAAVVPSTSAGSLTQPGTAAPEPPAAPVPAGVTARRGTGTVTVRWDAAPGVSGYLVERTTAAPGTGGRTWTRVARTTADATWATDRTVAGDRRYYYRVRSTTSATSGPSAEVRVPVATPVRSSRYLGPAGQVLGRF